MFDNLLLMGTRKTRIKWMFVDLFSLALCGFAFDNTNPNIYLCEHGFNGCL